MKSMDLSTYRERYGESGVARNYMTFEEWFRSECPEEAIRDFLRIEAAYMNSIEAFSELDSIESDDIFESLIGSTHDKADDLSRELQDAFNVLLKKIGKEKVNEYLSATY